MLQKYYKMIKGIAKGLGVCYSIAMSSEWIKILFDAMEDLRVFIL